MITTGDSLFILSFSKFDQRIFCEIFPLDKLVYG